MKVMSFNTQHCLNFITRKIDFPRMAEAILQCGADIVGLNEMRGEGVSPEYEAQTEALSALTGLSHMFFAPAIQTAGGPYGNGFLSRYPIADVCNIPVPDPVEKNGDGHYETRCLLKAKLENGLTVLVIHFGLNPDEQALAVQTVVENLEPKKCILMGDFNVEPEDAVLEPIRRRMVDTAAFFGSPLLSFPSDEPIKKIDYMFCTPDLSVLSADIPPVVASDHRPYLAEFDFDGE